MMTYNNKWVLTLVTAFSVLSSEVAEVRAHFLFAELDQAESPSQLLVTFSEPGMDSHMEFVSGRVNEMTIYQPTSPERGSTTDQTVIQLEDKNGYSTANMIENGISLLDESRPSYTTGYLDYGPFREMKNADLQYTFSAQTFTSMHPEDDWKNYFHHFLPTLGTGVFRIALRNYKAPYEVVVGGFEDLTTPIHVCLFSSNGKRMGCTTDTTAGKNHIMVDATETLRDCEQYLALANATVVEGEGETASTTMYWASTSVYMKGESCKSRAAFASGFQANGTSTWFVLGFFVMIVIGCCVRNKSAKAGTSMVAGVDVDDSERSRYRDGITEDEKTIELA